MNKNQPKRIKQFVTEVGVKSVPKAILTQHRYQFREDFNFSAAVYVPKANINHGAPEISVTISCGHNKITLKSKENIQEIIDGIIELAVTLQNGREIYNKTLIEEQETYYKAQEDERKRRTEDNVVPLKIAK